MVCFAKKFQENLVFHIKRPIRRLTIMADWREVYTYEKFTWEPGGTCELIYEGSKPFAVSFLGVFVVIRIIVVVLINFQIAKLIKL